jgi:hypothetical protein
VSSFRWLQLHAVGFVPAEIHSTHKRTEKNGNISNEWQ